MTKTILHVIDTSGPGGAETVFVDLATMLPADKFSTIVVIKGRGWVYDELVKRGITPIILNPKGSFNWKFLLALIKIIVVQRVDLIQSHLFGSNVYCALVGLMTRTPVVATFHGEVDIGVKEKSEYLKFAAINAGAKKIVCVSNSLKSNIVARMPINVNKLVVIYNGIDSRLFRRCQSSRLRKSYGWEQDDIVVGALGNIRKPKAYDILLKAAAELQNKKKCFRFVIAGQGNSKLLDDLISLKKELKLFDSVCFAGYQDNPAEFLSNLDIFVLSSDTEGFSIATIQAMASGLPVVVTKSGGPEEIVTNEINGILVNPGRPKEICDAIIRLSGNSGLRQRLADNARAKVEQDFDIKSMLSAYQKLYEEMT